MTEVAEKETKDVVPSTYREKYKATGGTCGDFIATQLSTVAKDGEAALNAVKAENNIETDKWSGLNAGMQRMNLANTLRARFLKGETVSILGKQYNAKHQAEDFNGEVKDDIKVLTKLAEYLGLQASTRSTDSLQKLFFPPTPKGPTKEEREAAKAAKAAEKEKAKADREAAAAAAKAAREAAKVAKADEKAAAKAKRDEEKAAKSAAKDAK